MSKSKRRERNPRVGWGDKQRMSKRVGDDGLTDDERRMVDAEVALQLLGEQATARKREMEECPDA